MGLKIARFDEQAELLDDEIDDIDEEFRALVSNRGQQKQPEVNQNMDQTRKDNKKGGQYMAAVEEEGNCVSDENSCYFDSQNNMIEGDDEYE